MNAMLEEEKLRVEAKLLQRGVPREQAEIVADVMVSADLYGVTSHGTRILDAHLKRIEMGGYNLVPHFEHIRETTSFAVIDGDNAIGFVSADHCMKYAVEKAKTLGMFTVFSRNNNTFGPAFYYPLNAAENGMIAFACCNSPAQMAPYGGKEKLLGTNPFAAAIPVPGHEPIMVDMATSIVAKSKFKEYKEQGKLLLDGWALDVEGRPTNDPDEGMKGFVQPMAGYKGYAIAMLIDIFSGLLSGASFLNRVGRFYSEEGQCMNVGHMFIAIDPKIVFGDAYADVINEYVRSIRSSANIEGQVVSIPGDRNHEAKRRFEQWQTNQSLDGEFIKT